MKKLMIVMPELYFGGAEKQFRYIIDGLSKLDNLMITVCIEQSVGTNLKKDIDNFIIEHKNVEFIKLNDLCTRSGNVKKLISSIKLYTKIISIIKKNKIDIIIGYGSLYPAIIPLLKRKNRKIVLAERCDGKYKNYLTTRTTKIADMVITNSRAAKEFMVSNGYKNVHCIRNGIIINNTFQSLANNNEFQILVPARVSHVKNQMLILKAAHLLNNKIDFKIVFVGEIQEEDYYLQCTEYIKLNSLERKIEFLGAVNNMEDYYKQCDVVVLASYFEGTPNVLLESFAYKRMCIASDIVMNRDLIEDNNYLFNLDKEQDLYNKLMFIKSMNESEKKTYIEKNYEFVNENFTIKSMINQYKIHLSL